MFEVVLFQPEIPPNTGNIIRLCAATGARLHLIEPLGFQWDDKRLRRAGLDYHEFAEVRHHTSLATFREALPGRRVFAQSRHATLSLHAARFAPGDVLLFGAETRGLPSDLGEQLPLHASLRIPMRPGIRSLNLANAVAVTLYEALRQCAGLAGTTEI
ncbi:MAG: tRNA (cytidine(34)-2'-O)-methyltransferase [Gammaproteobacteria bacterium]|nr:tRNA (cytidine(34)-2'-O)-methyltransferase [Gammaproteobacteria bacterium]